MALQERTAVNLKEVLEKIQDLQPTIGEKLWFRGVGAASYKLVPALYRTAKNEHELIEIQNHLIEEYSAKSILMDVGASPHYKDWDSLTQMQHYGIPTLLLDWTTSPFVALYFALAAAITDKKTEDPLIYCFNAERWNLDVHPILGTQPIWAISEIETFGLSPKSVNRSKPLAFWAKHSNVRIQRQQGTFLVFGSDKKPLEDYDHESSLARIRIPNADVGSLFKELQLVGVSATTIFPDLFGLGVELKHKYELQ